MDSLFLLVIKASDYPYEGIANERISFGRRIKLLHQRLRLQ